MHVSDQHLPLSIAFLHVKGKHSTLSYIESDAFDVDEKA